MIIYKPGQSLGRRSLGGVLRAKWDDDREAIVRAIAKRTAKGVPLDDGDGPLRDPGEYEADPEIDEVYIEVRALSVADVQKHDHAMSSTFSEVVKSEGDERLAARGRNREAANAFIKAAVTSVTGISGKDGEEIGGPLSDDVLEALWANNLAIAIVNAAQWLQHVRGEQRKNSGASQPKTSGSSTATPVPLNGESTEAAMGTRHLAVGSA